MGWIYDNDVGVKEPDGDGGWWWIILHGNGAGGVHRGVTIGRTSDDLRQTIRRMGVLLDASLSDDPDDFADALSALPGHASGPFPGISGAAHHAYLLTQSGSLAKLRTWFRRRAESGWGSP